jgi:hypothetical protein
MMCRLIAQTAAVAVALVVAVALLLLLPEHFPAIATHPDFAGALIGAAGTIFAGWLAWAAVRWQVARSERLAAIPEQEAIAVIRTELADFLGLLNQIWRAVDLALVPASNEARATYTRSLAETTATMLPPRAWAEEHVVAIASRLGTLRKQQFQRVIDSILAFYRMRDDEHAGDMPPLIRYRVLRTQLTFIEHFLRAFDPRMAEIFDGRQRSPIQLQATAETVAPLIDEAEQNPNRTTV